MSARLGVGDFAQLTLDDHLLGDSLLEHPLQAEEGVVLGPCVATRYADVWVVSRGQTGTNSDAST